MREHLLKRALPFILTFIIGAAVGGFFQLFGASYEVPGERRHHFESDGGRGKCRKFRQRRHAEHGRTFH